MANNGNSSVVITRAFPTNRNLLAKYDYHLKCNFLKRFQVLSHYIGPFKSTIPKYCLIYLLQSRHTDFASHKNRHSTSIKKLRLVVKVIIPKIENAINWIQKLRLLRVLVLVLLLLLVLRQARTGCHCRGA